MLIGAIIALTLSAVSPALGFEKAGNGNRDNAQATGKAAVRLIDEPKSEPGEVIVKLKPGSKLHQDGKKLKKYKVKTTEKVLDKRLEKDLPEAKDLYLFKNDPKEDARAVAAEISKDPEVEYAEPNYIVSVLATPNDPFFNSQWDLHNTGQFGGVVDADIDAPEAWDIKNNSSVVVGVIDTGIDYNHPDLSANIWTNPGETPNNSVDDDLNGFVDDYYGWDFANNDNNPMDDHGHGTHVAGTIAAVGNNGVGISGIAWQGKVAAIKFLNSGGYGSLNAAIQAIAYANKMGFKITNNSWGGGGFTQALFDVIKAGANKGYLFVAAAGNSFNDNDLYPAYPASYKSPNVIAVAATDWSDNKAYFTNYGKNSVQVGAPGVNIYSTVPGYGYYNPCALCDPSGYRYLSGTSMASPHVAGALAVYWSQYPNLTYGQVKQRLIKTADRVPAMENITASNGRLNFYNLLENDVIAPAPATDLRLVAGSVGASSVGLTWTATGDNWKTGQAQSYEIRYSTSTITTANFNSAQISTLAFKAGRAGSTENYTVRGLNPGTAYYFALKVRDNVGNLSGISNNAAAITKTLQTISFWDADDLEDGWTGAGLWHRETKRYYSPQKAWAYNTGSPNYNFDTGVSNSGSLLSPPIDLSDVNSPTLQFKYWYQTESTASYYDTRKISIGVNGLFTTVAQLSGEQMLNWHDFVLDLSSYAGQTIQIRFDFDTVDWLYNYFEGWYVDDIAILGSVSNNHAPVAKTKASYSGNEDAKLTLDASSSYDPDGDLLSYLWNFGDGNVWAGSSSSTITHIYSKGGSYPITLIVSDGQASSSTTSLAAIKEINDKPKANAGPDQKGYVGLPVNFDGSQSSDEEGPISLYQWNFGDNTPVATSTEPDISHTYAKTGNFTVTLTVIDSAGLKGTDAALVKIVTGW